MLKPDLSNIKEAFKFMYNEYLEVWHEMVTPNQRYDICLFLDISPDWYEYVQFANSDIHIDDLIYLIKKTDKFTDYSKLVYLYKCSDYILRDIDTEYGLYKLFIMLKTKIEINPRNHEISILNRDLLIYLAHKFRNISHENFQKIPNELLNEYLTKFTE